MIEPASERLCGRAGDLRQYARDRSAAEKSEDGNGLMSAAPSTAGVTAAREITPANVGVATGLELRYRQIEARAPPVVKTASCSSPRRNQLLALEAKTGKVLWRYKAVPED